jgi:Na+-transporting NADH:ubiquinone oxidoreductase subunit NqrC
LEEARAALHEDPEAVRRLTAEVTSLRKANMCLRAALEDSEAKMAAKERQQQILLETLVTNGQMRKMGEILVGAGVITREQLQEALTEQEASPERMLGAILVEKGQVREEDVAQAVACQARLPVVDLSEKMVSPEAARLLDEALCKKHQCIPVRTTQDQVFLAMTNPRDSAAMAATERASGRRVVPLVATPSGICCAINTVFGVH